MPPADLRAKRTLQFAAVVLAILFTLYTQWRRGGEIPAPGENLPEPSAVERGESAERTGRLPNSAAEDQLPGRDLREADSPPLESDLITSVEGQVIRNLDGEVVFRGTVDLSATLARIQAGKRLSYPNDGSVFQNREKRLPNKPSGHYREFVHPTPNLGGPGPQRIVTGSQGEYYYTPDHYRTFRKLNP